MTYTHFSVRLLKSTPGMWSEGLEGQTFEVIEDNFMEDKTVYTLLFDQLAADKGETNIVRFLNIEDCERIPDEPTPKPPLPPIQNIITTLTDQLYHEHPAMEVCRELDEFQRDYHRLSQDNAPGNDLWATRLLQIVAHARQILAD